MEPFSQVPLAASIHAISECASDNVFGPFSNCRFYFTLFFEQAIISAVLAIFLLFSAPSRIYTLARQDGKVLPRATGVEKLILTIPFALVQLVFLGFESRCRNPDHSPLLFGAQTLRAPILNFERVFSFLFHIRSRPSKEPIYPRRRVDRACILYALVLKLLLFIVESLNKSSFLKPQYEDLAPEAMPGISIRSFLWWLNGLFSKGSKRFLKFEELYGLDPELEAETVGEKLRRAWGKRSEKEGRLELAFALWRALKGSFALALFPRLCLIWFTFAQPFLITRVLNLLEQVDDEISRKQGCGLMGAAVLIYLGIAVSTLISGHNLNRFVTVFREGMVSLIYDRALLLKDGVYDESAAVSLMSNDVDQISDCLEGEWCCEERGYLDGD